MPSWAAVVGGGERKCDCSQRILLDMSQDEKQEKERNPLSSLSLSDVEDQTNFSSSSCFHYISSKQDPAPHQAHSNPQSSFYCVKNTQSSPFLPSTAPVSRPANARTIFTVIAPIPQDAAACSNVREQLAYRSFFFLFVVSSSKKFLFHRSENKKRKCKNRRGQSWRQSHLRHPRKSPT